MTDVRQRLLERVIDEVANNGLADRSLRDVAAAIGSSHRMLHYHFGSRAGLVAAIVHAVEARQRLLLADLAKTTTGPGDLVLALWARLSTAEMLPYVRLFFECVASPVVSTSITPHQATGPGASGNDHDLTDPWLRSAAAVAATIGTDVDMVDLQLGVAVTRGLLIDVLTTGDATQATKSLQRYVSLWLARRGSE
jgi:AcrR family transcriptional regulator